MAKYQILETNILSAFKVENLKAEENNPIILEELVDFFNVYWKNYQDKWTQKYWQIYESTHNICDNSDFESEKNNENESKNQEGKLNQNEYVNESISNSHLPTTHNNYFKNNNYSDENENKNVMNSKDNFRSNSTNVQTKTLINLQDIDDELDKINEISLIKEKIIKPEKRRNCLECNIF